MADIKIAAVMRAGAYSPNHLANDAAILNAVTEQLRKRGCEVKVYSEERLNRGEVTEDIIINMCRESRSIDLLEKREEEGALVINSGYGIENSTCERMTRLLMAHNMPYPESMIVNTDEVVKQRLMRAGFTRCWIKRADYPLHKEDVTYVHNPEEAQEVLQEYFLRGIKRAVITKHVEGELIKFYCVAGSPFFYLYSPYSADSRRNSGKNADHAFDRAALRKLCDRVSEILDLKIFGGDCVVDPEGHLTIIDINDWPSFAPCRQDAAAAIAKAVIAEIKSRRGSAGQ